MTRLMLAGVLRGDVDPPENAPDHTQVAAAPWTALALSVPTTSDLDKPDEAAALATRQHELLCRYIVDADVIPISFGAFFSSKPGVCAHLRAEDEALVHVSQRLAGCVEYSIQITRMSEPTPVPATTGAAHLRARRARRDRHRDMGREVGEIVSEIEHAVGAWTVARSSRPSKDPTRLQTIDLLLRRKDVAACIRALRDTGKRVTSLNLELTFCGPYPAFSFIAAGADV